MCVLQDESSGKKYCALTCFLGGCPTGATCRHAGLVGLCMYDKDVKEEAKEVKPLALTIAPTANSSHYEKPPCRSDEQSVQVQGLQGETCVPECDGMSCPTDVPAGATAKPMCVLQDESSGKKYCALTCFLGGCPTGATCRHAGLVGLCMYDKTTEENHLALTIAEGTTDKEIVV